MIGAPRRLLTLTASAVALGALVLSPVGPAGSVPGGPASTGSTPAGPAPATAWLPGDPRDDGGNQGVRIRRDMWGVPHIYADTVHDLFYGYGYAAAQDRLFQMEMSKRSVNGTVSEVLGADYVPFDSEVRANRNPASLSRQYDALAGEDRDIFEGYAAGVNAWREQVAADPDHLLPKQFVDYGFEPSGWTGMDVVMVFVGTMANRYSDGTAEVANLRVRDDLLATYGEGRGLALFDQLIWNFDPLAPTTVPPPPQERSSAAPEPDGAGQNLRRLLPVSPDVPAGDAEPATFSNVWLTGKDKTLGARSMLVNGPQFGWYNPAYTYSVGLHGAGFDVVGNTPFAYPVVLFGHNGRIGWGATAGVGDTVDLYQEILKPGDLHSYLFEGEWRQMTHRAETIAVRDADPVTVDVHYTVHGRVISTDTARNTAYSKKRSWEGSEVESLLGWIHSTRATNHEEWRAQSQRMAISINWYYVDGEGNIAYVLNGKYPDRPAGQDQRLPALGTGEMEWSGILPYDTNPQVLNPEQGFLANWNNKQAPESRGTFSVVDRVALLRRELDGPEPLTPDELWDINYRATFSDPGAHYFLPHLERAVADEPAGSPLRTAVEELLAWNQLNADVDRDGRYDSPAVTVFRAFLDQMISLTLADDLDPAMFGRFFANGYPSATAPAPDSQRPGLGTILVYNALLGEDAGVPQTVDLLGGRDPGELLRQALGQALAALEATHGPDRTTWLTPTVPHTFRTTNFAGIPQANPDEQLQLPTYMNRGTENNRITFYPDDKVSGCEAAPPGQSGFVAPDGTPSRHYTDQLTLYENFECKRTWFTPREVDTHTVESGHLVP